ncbi:hypothetical protein ACIPUO_06290 [Pectobacterium carotovorum]|uniref:hypothetical protein n=1 Tax=Pectobacterium carotovorum TaxID=554 RepID=UPI00381EEB7D
MASNAIFRVRGEHGSVQIDRDYRNLFLSEKIKITTFQEANDFDRPYIQAEVPFTSNSIPFVAISATTAGSSITGLLVNGNNYTAIVITNDPSEEHFLYVFSVIDGTPSNRGLIIRNESNQIVFDAGKKPLRVVKNYNGSRYPDNHNLKVEQNRRYAGFCGLRWWFKVQQGGRVSGWDDQTKTGEISLVETSWTTGFSVSGSNLNPVTDVTQPFGVQYFLWFDNAHFNPAMSFLPPGFLINPQEWYDLLNDPNFDPATINEQFESGFNVAYTIIDVTHY